MGWETERTTQAGTRYGCFLPDLTGLARSLSAADLPPHYIRAPERRGKFQARRPCRAPTRRSASVGPLRDGPVASVNTRKELAGGPAQHPPQRASSSGQSGL